MTDREFLELIYITSLKHLIEVRGADMEPEITERWFELHGRYAELVRNKELP